MNKTFFTCSVLLFAVALVTTFLSLAHVDVEQHLPYISLMNVGVIASVVPALFILRKNTEIKWPSWTKITFVALWLFTFYFFWSGFFNSTPVSSHGKYFLVSHGGSPRIYITKDEFLKVKTQNFVSRSSLWMLFSGFSAVILYYSGKKANFNEQD